MGEVVEMYEVPKQEYLLILEMRKEKARKALQEAEEEIAKVLAGSRSNEVAKQMPSAINNVANESTGKSTRGAVGWKFIIDEILKTSNRPLSSGEIVSLVGRLPGNRIPRSVAQKSVGSALSTNSQPETGRYIRTNDKGVYYYALNPKFEE